MFTGIVEEVGLLKEIVTSRQSMTLRINCSLLIDDLKIGDSVAVNGICLTVKEFAREHFSVDVMPETMRKTGLSKLRKGDRVNLERALLLQQRLGGHLVSGHIDGVGIVKNKSREGNAIWLSIETSNEISRYLIEKGSVTVDGVSLTIAKLDSTSFQVSLIPVTASTTTLGEKRIGDWLNVECDILGKYLEKYLINLMAKEAKGINLASLAENGF